MVEESVLWEALTLVVCVLLFHVWERRRPARAIDKGRDLRLDLFAFGVVIVAGTVWKALVLEGLNLVHFERALGFLAPVRHWSSVARILTGIVLADFCLYWLHWAMHASPALWRTHMFHHSIRDLYWLSGARTSVTHLLLFAIPQVLIASFILSFTPAEAAIAFSFGVVVNLWVHTNLDVRLGPLEWLIITPQFHRYHHGRDLIPTKNLGFFLTVWDRLFGTFDDPNVVRDNYPLGLTADEKMPRMIVGV